MYSKNTSKTFKKHFCPLKRVRDYDGAGRHPIRM